MLSAAGPIVGRIRRYYIMYETTIKFQLVVFIFDPEKSVVLFSHPTQPTHEFGGHALHASSTPSLHISDCSASGDQEA